jgi:hypothetical protein
MKNIEVNGKSWKPTKSWFIRGKTFSVEVNLHTVEPVIFDGFRDDRGESRWCIYAYIFPTHPLFSKFESDQIYQDATEIMPFHCGCTYLKRSPDVVKVGCDYNHLHDEFYTHIEGPEDSLSVFNDANELVDWLEEREPKGVPA